VPHLAVRIPQYILKNRRQKPHPDSEFVLVDPFNVKHAGVRVSVPRASPFPSFTVNVHLQRHDERSTILVRDPSHQDGRTPRTPPPPIPSNKITTFLVRVSSTQRQARPPALFFPPTSASSLLSRPSSGEICGRVLHTIIACRLPIISFLPNPLAASQFS
jgi:hypothetical protein